MTEERRCGVVSSHEPHDFLDGQFHCPGFGKFNKGAWNRPLHYGGEENPFEPIKIIEHYDLNFNLGNVIKYTLRAPLKGTALADLKKAYTYIGFEIRKRERAGETE